MKTSGPGGNILWVDGTTSVVEVSETRVERSTGQLYGLVLPLVPGGLDSSTGDLR